MNINQRKFTEHLIKCAEAELREAIQAKNVERTDILLARINAYRMTLEENDNDLPR